MLDNIDIDEIVVRVKTNDEELIFSNESILEKKALREMLEKDIQEFLDNGGSITYKEGFFPIPKSNKVNFNREGMTGLFTDFSRDSV